MGKQITRAIILAQGESTRWRNEHERKVPVPYKQLIPLLNGTILSRTIHQITEIGISCIVICTEKFRKYSNLNVPCYEIQGTPGTTPQGISYTYHIGLWQNAERVICLFGDVIYSNNAINIINHDTFPVSIYGRLGGNEITGKHSYVPLDGDSELFGISVYRDKFEEVINDIGSKTVARYKAKPLRGDRGKTMLWDIYHSNPPYLLQGLTQFYDYTDDIDWCYEYYEFFPKLKECVLLDDEWIR